MIEGQTTFKVVNQRIEATPGIFVNVPPNVLHIFNNETNKIVKLIIALYQQGME